MGLSVKWPCETLDDNTVCMITFKQIKQIKTFVLVFYSCTDNMIWKHISLSKGGLFCMFIYLFLTIINKRHWGYISRKRWFGLVRDGGYVVCWSLCLSAAGGILFLTWPGYIFRTSRRNRKAWANFLSLLPPFPSSWYEDGWMDGWTMLYTNLLSLI